MRAMSAGAAGPTLPVSLVVVDRWIRAGLLRLDKPGTGKRRRYPEAERRAMVALDACRRLGGIDPDGEALTGPRRVLLAEVAEAARSNPAGAVVEIVTPVPWVHHVLIVPEP